VAEGGIHFAGTLFQGGALAHLGVEPDDFAFEQARLSFDLPDAGLVGAVGFAAALDLGPQLRQELLAMPLGERLAARGTHRLAGAIEHAGAGLDRLGLRPESLVRPAQPGCLLGQGNRLRARSLKPSLDGIEGRKRRGNLAARRRKGLAVGPQASRLQLALGLAQLPNRRCDPAGEIVDLALQEHDLAAGLLQIGPLALGGGEGLAELRRDGFRLGEFFLIGRAVRELALDLLQAPFQTVDLIPGLSQAVFGPLLKHLPARKAEDIAQDLFALRRRLLGEFVGPPLNEEGRVDERLVVEPKQGLDLALGGPHGGLREAAPGAGRRILPLELEE